MAVGAFCVCIGEASFQSLVKIFIPEAKVRQTALKSYRVKIIVYFLSLFKVKERFCSCGWLFAFNESLDIWKLSVFFSTCIRRFLWAVVDGSCFVNAERRYF